MNARRFAVWLNSRRTLRASVVVPVYNGRRTIGACLRALSTQNVDGRHYEVIVVDDGSTDGSAETAAGHCNSVLRQRHEGAASARNRGAREARGEILLFTDADCEPAPDWIQKMLSPFEDPELAGVKGAYRTRQRSLVARFTQAEFEEKYDRLQRTPRIDFVDTYSAGYRRDAFLELGGFDPGIRYAEDQEFSFRMARAGHKMVFEPAAIVYHHHPNSIWRYGRRKAQFGRWKVAVLRRYPSKVLRDSYTPWTQRAQLVLVPLLFAMAMAASAVLPWWLVLVPAGLGLLSAFPLMIKAAHQGWQVAALSPALVLLRALALDIGLIWGAFDYVRDALGAGLQPALPGRQADEVD